MSKKLLIMLLLVTTLQLNYASNPDALADEMLGVLKPERPTAVIVEGSEQQIKTLGLPKRCREDCCHKGLGLDESDPDIVEHMKKLIGERYRRDYEIEHRNISWARYFFRIFKRGYFYFFDNRENSPANNQAVVINTEDDELSAASPIRRGSTKVSSSLGTSKIDILAKMTFDSSMVYDQGDINSCTANAMGFIIRYWSVLNSPSLANTANGLANRTNFTASNPDLLNPSRLYHYCNSRMIVGKIGTNQGVSAEHAILSIDKYGTCPENVMTIETTIKTLIKAVTQSVKVGLGYPVKTNPSAEDDCSLTLSDPTEPEAVVKTNLTLDQVVAVKPTLETYRLAFDANCSGLSSGVPNPYAFVSQKIRYDYLGNDVAKFKTALESGYPIFWGAKVYSAFMNDAYYYDPSKEKPKPLFVPMPTEPFNGSQTSEGGHAMVIVGWGNYNPAVSGKNYFKVLNSWGPKWSDRGFCYFPEEYITGQTIVNNSDGTVTATAITGTTSTSTNTVSAYAVYFK